jgi:hypothetical protein
MNITMVLPGHGLLFDGQPHEDSDDYQAMLDAARDWLIGHGMSRLEATHRTVWRPGLVAGDAWVTDHAHGPHCDDGCAGVIDFAQAHHDGARPVSVVHVPVPEEVGDGDQTS